MRNEAAVEKVYKLFRPFQKPSIDELRHWVGHTYEQIIDAALGGEARLFAEWVAQQGATIETLTEQVKTLSKRPTNQELQAALTEAGRQAGLAAEAQRLYEEEQRKPPVEIVKYVEVEPSWITKIKDFLKKIVKRGIKR